MLFMLVDTCCNNVDLGGHSGNDVDALVVVVVMLMMLVDRCCNVVDVGSCSSNVDDG